MHFLREMNRVLVGLLIAFALIALAAAYWGVASSGSLLSRDDNPRLVELENRIQRGAIYDRAGTLLVNSEPDEFGVVTRQYLFPAFYSALGYSSLRYGVGGLESAYNALLRGDTAEAITAYELLHRPIRGSDLQLTLDANIQNALYAAMNGQRGAAIVLSIPDGQTLAMVSLPTFDPNYLDEQWDTLNANPNNPFFNRALQGSYQPGGTMETPLMMGALLSTQPLDEEIEDGSAPFDLNGLEITCAVRLPLMPMTLRDGYAFACPTPFVQLGESLGSARLQSLFDQVQSLTQYRLLPIQPVSNGTATPETTAQLLTTEDELLANVLGQGNITVTPLMMAMIAGAVANDGNAPQPYLLEAIRSPGEATWQPVETAHPTVPITTANTARRLQDLMRYNVVNGAAQNAGRPFIDIGGHASLAYSGDTTNAWFIGFATLGGRQAVAIAIVLENSADAGLASDIGGSTLQAASAALAGS